MEKDTEKQILNELENINKALQDIHKKLDTQKNEEERPFGIGDILKSLLIGVFVVGPAIVVIVAIIMIVGYWITG